jgi:tripartite-type tricarboxylate transporter receptor subunit TctC
LRFARSVIAFLQHREAAMKKLAMRAYAISASAALTSLYSALAVMMPALLLTPATAQAQTYPSRPITMIVPFAAGGPTDMLARLVGDHMRRTLGQTVVIENVTGAGGTIGVTRVVNAAPDGYTLSVGHLGTHVINGAIYPLPYDLVDSLEPVAMLPSNPMVVVSRNSLPAKNAQELVAWLKANKATAGTAGVGSGSHFSGVYFEKIIGTQFTFVPYRGTGPALQDLVAGQIDIIVDQTSNSMQQIRSGSIRAYAITADKRIAAAPEIPAADEAGLKGFYIQLWSGVWAPKGTPKDIVDKLNGAVVAALNDPGVAKRMADVGLELPPADLRTPQALAAYQKAEKDKWYPIIKAANLRPE